MPESRIQNDIARQQLLNAFLNPVNYGNREDGTRKGSGWIGEIPMSDGRVMTELAIGVNFDGKETLIPAIVPTLNKEEIRNLSMGEKISDTIIQKAVDHAKQRIALGKSPFADELSILNPQLDTRGADYGTISAPTWEERNPTISALMRGLGLRVSPQTSTPYFEPGKEMLNALGIIGGSNALAPQPGEKRQAYLDIPILGSVDLGFKIPAMVDESMRFGNNFAQTGLAAADLAALAPIVGRRAAVSLGNEAGVISPNLKSVNRGENLFDLWGKDDPKQMQFDAVNRLPELQHKLVKGKGIEGILYGTKLDPGVEQIVSQFGDNQFHRELSALYNTGKINIDRAKDLFEATVNRDKDGLSVFDKVLDLEIRRRAESFTKPGWKPYREETFNISRGRGSNAKTGDELLPMDTSRGCIGSCIECYSAYGGSQQSRTCFMSPQPVKLIGKFADDPQAIRRIGENGEPNMNPLLWKEIEPEFQARLQTGKPMTSSELDEFIERSYDWSYTNDQIKRTGLDSAGQMKGNKYIPGGRDHTFLITQLQSLKNFDPDLIRNLEVSIDPMSPSHFFKSLKNIETLKAEDPGVNIMLRIRSIATASDEINTLQKIAVDFAKQNRFPVLETRVRFKKADTAAQAQILPEYYRAGGQYKHLSYYPSQKPGLEGAVQVEGNNIRSFEIHTENGPAPTQVYLQSPADALKGLSNNQKKTAPVWSVWNGGKKVASKLSIDEATEIGSELAKNTNLDKVPSKITVRQYSLEESPLSQFGLDPALHKQCNTFNIGAGACGECQACRAWLNEAKARSYEAGISKKQSSRTGASSGAVATRNLPDDRLLDSNIAPSEFGVKGQKNSIIAELTNRQMRELLNK